MFDYLFRYTFLLGLIVTGIVRGVYGRRYKQAGKTGTERPESLAVAVLMALWGISQLLGLVYIFTPWLRFADYRLPVWAGLVGIGIFAAGVWLLWRSHTDLGRHWSPTLEVQAGHRLVTEGVYRHIRHPMYAAHWLWVIGQPLLLHNWLAGVPPLIVFAFLYLLRVFSEEQMMLDRFGPEYRAYMQKTGRIIPRLR